jgi:hypothetical protein
VTFLARGELLGVRRYSSAERRTSFIDSDPSNPRPCNNPDRPAHQALRCVVLRDSDGIIITILQMMVLMEQLFKITVNEVDLSRLTPAPSPVGLWSGVPRPGLNVPRLSERPTPAPSDLILSCSRPGPSNPLAARLVHSYSRSLRVSEIDFRR